ncbi:MAG: hypothetical protein ACREMF_09620, partial [Gemmatimonadales bacterium]
MSLGWLFKREYFRSSGARLAEAALAVSPGALFYRLSLGAQQLGYASTTVDTLIDSIRVVDVLVFDVPALGRLYRTEGRSVATLDRALHLLGLTAEVNGDVGRFATRATISDDSSFHLTIRSDGDSFSSSAKPPRPIVLPSLLPLRLAFGGDLRIGRAVSTRLLDPFTLTEHGVQVRVTAESTLIVADSADYDSTAMAWVAVHSDTVRAYRVDLDGGAGPLTTWIDGQGRVVRATSPLGYSVERTAFEIAYENFRRRDTLRLARASASPAAGDVIALTLLAAGVAPRRESRPVRRFRLGGATLDGLELDGGRQHLVADTLVVEREAADRLRASYRLPNRRLALREFLGPAPLIETTDLRVAAQARVIAGG